MRNISVRFTQDEFDQMQALALRYQVPQATIVRWSISALFSHVEKHDGKVTLPLDFSAPRRAEHLNEGPAPYSSAPSKDSGSAS